MNYRRSEGFNKKRHLIFNSFKIVLSACPDSYRDVEGGLLNKRGSFSMIPVSTSST